MFKEFFNLTQNNSKKNSEEEKIAFAIINSVSAGIRWWFLRVASRRSLPYSSGDSARISAGGAAFPLRVPRADGVLRQNIASVTA